jgi:hypothetical protein
MSRFWLALVYGLATVLAQGVHNHAGSDDGRSVQHEAGCSDSRLHLSGHWSPDLSHAQDDCLACQFRANHHPWSLTVPTLDRPSAVHSVVVLSHTAPRHFVRLSQCRAPPRLGTV